MKMLLAILLIVLVVAVTHAQTSFPLTCQEGLCVIRESDVEKLQKLIDFMARRIQELQDRSGCS